MLRFALRNLWHEKVRLFTSVGGVAAALVLVLILEGAYAGSAGQMVAYIEKSDAEVWVMQEGVSNMHMATSVVPVSKAQQIGEVAGVEAVTPIVYISNVVKANGREWFSYVVGLPQDAASGGPWAMTAGQPNPRVGEVIVPQLLAEKGGVSIGQFVTLFGKDFRVVGLSKGTFSLVNSITFLAYEDLEQLLAMPGAASYFLVQVQAGIRPEQLASRIGAEVSGVNAVTKKSLAAADRIMTRQMGVDIIQLVSLIGLVTGGLVIGFTVYAATVRRSKEYGIARALGAKLRHLFGIVVLQALVIALLSGSAAIALAFLARLLVSNLAPEVPLAYPPSGLARIGIIVFGIAVVAAVAPAYRVARADPATVFRE